MVQVGRKLNSPEEFQASKQLVSQEDSNDAVRDSVLRSKYTRNCSDRLDCRFGYP